MTYPYSDEFMVYDYENHRYILTEKDVEVNLGISLSARSKNANARAQVLKQVSRQIYSFIHDYSFTGSEIVKDYVIATTENGRKKIKEAMEQQLIYFLTVGDVSRTTDETKRKMRIDETAKSILEEYLPELGTNLLYTGKLRCVIDNSKEW